MFVNKLKLEKKYTTPSPFTLKSAPPAQFLHLWVLRAFFLSRGVTSMRLLWGVLLPRVWFAWVLRRDFVHPGVLRPVVLRSEVLHHGVLDLCVLCPGVLYEYYVLWVLQLVVLYFEGLTLRSLTGGLHIQGSYSPVFFYLGV